MKKHTERIQWESMMVYRSTFYQSEPGIITVIGMALVFFTLGAQSSPADAQKEWVCKADGIYSNCQSSRSLRQCEDYRASGTGVAEDRLEASMQAEETCSDNLIRTVVAENRNGRLYIKVRCSTVECERR